MEDEVKLSKVPFCGAMEYSAGDINRDCQVNLGDFAVVGEDWMKCTTPDGQNCIDVR